MRILAVGNVNEKRPDSIVVKVVEDGQAALVALPVVRLGSTGPENSISVKINQLRIASASTLKSNRLALIIASISICDFLFETVLGVVDGWLLSCQV